MGILGFIVITAKRAAVLVIGSVAIWFGLDKVFPYLDHKVPVALAVILTYSLMAYVIIPFAIRIIRLFWRTDHIPRHTVTPDGFAGDPVNIALVGTRRDILSAFSKAGWHEADPKTVRSAIRMATAFVFKQPYPTAPFSTLYLFGRGQDLGLQKPIDNSPRKRHHVRFWQVQTVPSGRFREHVKYWLKHYGHIQPGRSLWIGAATRDTGLGIITHNAQVTHRIHPDTDAERDFLVKELKHTGCVTSSRNINTGDPYTLPNRVRGITVQADGQITLLELNR